MLTYKTPLINVQRLTHMVKRSTFQKDMTYGGEGSRVRVPVETIYFIVIKEFSCKKKKKFNCSTNIYGEIMKRNKRGRLFNVLQIGLITEPKKLSIHGIGIEPIVQLN